MSFSIALPLSGYGGWKFLRRTEEAQMQRMQADPIMQRDEAYFREKIGSVTTADQLVSDKRLLRVALGAYGLSGDVNNTYFIKKVLQDGTLDTGDLANRLTDKNYAALSSAFGFGDYSVPATQVSTFADDILARYEQRKFEEAVGDSNGDYRIALYAERELPALAAKTLSEDGKWFSIMGSAPLREFFETAFGLPSSFSGMDVDQQLVVLKDKSDRLFGTSDVSDFTSGATLDKLVRQYLLRAEIAAGSASAGSGSAALQVLQAGQSSLAALLAR